MLTVAEARDRIVRPLLPTPPEIVPIAEAWGRVTTAALAARLHQPPHDMSAMDGFAVRANDALVGARLRVVGSAPAGHPWTGSLASGEALRIFTGSVMPDGADAVLLQEDADVQDGCVVPREAATRGRHIRRAGQDFARDAVVVPAQRRLTVRDIGIAAAANHPWIAVHRRPRVAILATGDEIALPGEPIVPGGIVSSNAHALAAFARALGAEPTVLPIAGDTLEAIAAGADAARGADMLVTTGGASVGEHDLVQAGLGTRGMALDFWKIAMRPGKPLMSGRIGDLPVLGLPGNPVSALVCAVLFLLPALSRLSGLPGDAPATRHAVLGAPLPANDHRADHLRASIATASDGTLTATAFDRQDSAMLRLLAHADALILREPNAAAAAAGDIVQVVRLDALGL